MQLVPGVFVRLYKGLLDVLVLHEVVLGLEVLLVALEQEILIDEEVELGAAISAE